MAQETAASMAAPEGPIWRAWIDAFIHPKFETYASWYLRMNARWRRISLAVSLALLSVAAFVLIAHDVMHGGYHRQILTLNRYLSYLGSPHGLFELFALLACAGAAIFAFPSIVAWFAPRSLGPYSTRRYIVYCTWMQTLPMISAFLLLGAVGYFILGFFTSSEFIYGAANYLLVGLPVLLAQGLIYHGLSTASRLTALLISFAVQVLYVIVVLLIWYLLGHILVSLGYPVL